MAVDDDPRLAAVLRVAEADFGVKAQRVTASASERSSPAQPAAYADRAVQRAGIEEMPAQAPATARLMVPLPEPEGPSMVRTGIALSGFVMALRSRKARDSSGGRGVRAYDNENPLDAAIRSKCGNDVATLATIVDADLTFGDLPRDREAIATR